MHPWHAAPNPCCPAGQHILWLFLYCSVQSFPVETASTNALLGMSKSHTPPPLRLFPCLPLTRRRMRASLAHWRVPKTAHESKMSAHTLNTAEKAVTRERVSSFSPRHAWRGFTEPVVKVSQESCLLSPSCRAKFYGICDKQISVKSQERSSPMGEPHDILRRERRT